jgi:hypothetical protein
MVTAATIQAIEEGWFFSPSCIKFFNGSTDAAFVVFSVAPFAFHI